MPRTDTSLDVRCAAYLTALLMPTFARGAEPWAAMAAFEPICSFERIVIPNGDDAVYHRLEFPAVKKKPGTRTVLRFRSRLHYDRPCGWNYYLGLHLNGTQLEGFTHNGTPRLINRDLQVTLDEGRPYTWPWWNRISAGVDEMALLTFFGPGGEVLDQRIKSDRGELYWFVVDVDDLINYHVRGLDEVVVHDEPNRLRLSNGLVSRLVKGAAVDLIIDGLQLGTFQWLHDSTPRVLVFDMAGREARAPVETEGRSITISLEDWEHIAAVEPRP